MSKCSFYILYRKNLLRLGGEIKEVKLEKVGYAKGQKQWDGIKPQCKKLPPRGLSINSIKAVNGMVF